MTQNPTIPLLALCIAAAITGAGCASLGGGGDVATERLLAAAGFQMRLAGSEARRAELARLPQRKLGAQDHHGRTFYLYADADGCGCLYVGTPRAYDRYERLAIAHEQSVRRLDPVKDDPLGAVELSDWGPWAPWWW